MLTAVVSWDEDEDLGGWRRKAGWVHTGAGAGSSSHRRSLAASSTQAQTSNMCSHRDGPSGEIGPIPRPPEPSAHVLPAPARPTTAVWVLLDHLVRHDQAAYRSVADGLDFTGRTRGVLLRDTWIRSSRGLWLAKVNYSVRYADGRTDVALFHEQLIPAYALLKRSDNNPIGSQP
jgi:hypothetical protein